MASLQQHKYYRGVVLPAIREHSGYPSDAHTHAALKAGFFLLDPNGPLPSMADMGEEEASRFIEWAIQQAADMECIIPEAAPRDEDVPPARHAPEIAAPDCNFSVGKVHRR